MALRQQKPGGQSSWPLILIDASVLLADPDVMVRIIANGGLPVVSDTVLARIESAGTDSDRLVAERAKSILDLLAGRSPVEMGALPNGRRLQPNDTVQRLTFKDCPVYLLTRNPVSSGGTSMDTLVALASDYGMRLITCDPSTQAKAAAAGAKVDFWTGPQKGDSGSSSRATPRSRSTRNLRIVGFALVAVALIIWLNSQKTPVEPRPSAPIASQPDYAADVQRLLERAMTADQAAFERFERSLESTASQYQTDSLAASEAAASSLATYRSIRTIISKLAYDRIKGTSEADHYIQGEVARFLRAPIETLEGNANTALAVLDNDLRKNSVQLAVDLAALGPTEFTKSARFAPSGNVAQDFEKALRNLGIDTAALGAAIAFDIYAIVNTSVVRRLVSTLSSIAGRLFARQAFKASVAITGPVVDGPLPFGDVVAIGFGFWTAYDIIRLRPEFHAEVKTVSEHYLREIGTEWDSKVREAANEQSARFKDVQARMGRESLKQLMD